jgi:hypothetical protein
MVGPLPFIENANHETLELEIFSRIQHETLLQKQQAEVRSAILALITNLTYITLIVIVFLIGTLKSSDLLLVIFSLLKSHAPIISSIINFAKIRALLRSVCDELQCSFD